MEEVVLLGFTYKHSITTLFPYLISLRKMCSFKMIYQFNFILKEQ